MRRLHETELNIRIHNFLHRKLSEFPELTGAKRRPRRVRQGQEDPPAASRLDEIWVF
jgi:hypothetical protein